ncbi:MAG: YlmH/Sll1252 family protein [Oscillospiraceae bacterium]
MRSAEICSTARSSDEPRYAQRGRTLPFRAHRRYAETGCKVRRSAVLHVLNEREAAVARYAVRGELAFFGGYDGAARTVCGVLEGTYAQEMSLEDVFPVGAVTFTFRKSDKLTHREFLGALLSLEIKRELLGDILVAEGYAVVFVYETAIELVSRVDRIGRVGVTAEVGITKPLPEQKMERRDVTVSSLRLDCIVAAAANTSREKSAALIKSGMVSADHTPCTIVAQR